MKRSTLICTALISVTGALAGTSAMAQKPAPMPHAPAYTATTTAPKAKAPEAPKATAARAAHKPTSHTPAKHTKPTR
ncbi:hypothetical protein [Alcaligenes sp. Lyrl_28]|uniref:hypothetical protein n=1 Tax=Alcaligenes sp. Lyrl_28 TaxID=3110924 RepID=UPI003F7B3695